MGSSQWQNTKYPASYKKGAVYSRYLNQPVSGTVLGHLGIGRGRASWLHPRRWCPAVEGGAPRSELQVAYEDQHGHGVGEDGAGARGRADC